MPYGDHMRTIIKWVPWRTPALLLAGTLALAGCGTSPSTEAGPAAAPSGTTGATGTAPVTIRDDCGRDVVVPAPPRRAVALEQGATEVMLSLGLADRMVGTSYLTDPILPALREDYAKVPVLAAQYPSPETFRDADPDFAYSMLSSAFTPDVAGTRAELARAQVPTYVTRTNCEDASLNQPFTFDAFFTEVTDVATLFGVRDRGDELVASQRRSLAEAEEAAASVTGRPTIMWLYSTYDGAPIVAGPGGVPDAVDDLVGARNVFDDLTPTWGEVSWEEIAARNPDVIVIADLTRGRPGDSASDKRKILAEHPVASKLSAVAAGHVVALPGSALDPSVRSVDVVPALTDALVEQGFGS